VSFAIQQIYDIGKHQKSRFLSIMLVMFFITVWLLVYSQFLHGYLL